MKMAEKVTDKAVKDSKDVEKKKPATVKPVKEKVKLKVRISNFIREYKSEIKKIVWPTMKQLVSSTKIVLIAIVILGIAVGVIDFLFSKGILLLGNLL